MNISKEFIKVTAQYDNMPAYIRSNTIESVLDNAEQKDGEQIRFACRTINYSGRSINVVESIDEIMNQIWESEL